MGCGAGAIGAVAGAGGAGAGGAVAAGAAGGAVAAGAAGWAVAAGAAARASGPGVGAGAGAVPCAYTTCTMNSVSGMSGNTSFTTWYATHRDTAIQYTGIIPLLTNPLFVCCCFVAQQVWVHGNAVHFDAQQRPSTIKGQLQRRMIYLNTVLMQVPLLLRVIDIK